MGFRRCVLIPAKDHRLNDSGVLVQPALVVSLVAAAQVDNTGAVTKQYCEKVETGLIGLFPFGADGALLSFLRDAHIPV